MAHLGNGGRNWRHSGMPDTLPGLERHMETESVKEQLSGAGFYDLNFNGR